MKALHPCYLKKNDRILYLNYLKIALLLWELAVGFLYCRKDEYDFLPATYQASGTGIMEFSRVTTDSHVPHPSLGNAA